MNIQTTPRSEQELVVALQKEYEFMMEWEDGATDYDAKQWAIQLEVALQKQYNYSKADIDMIWDDAEEAVSLAGVN